MKKEKALYFPYINLPKKKWTYQTLLYWDSLTSIVPTTFFENPEKEYEPFMLELVKNELVIQLEPAEYIHKIKNLDIVFSTYVENKYKKVDYKPKNFVRVHFEKLNYRLRNSLIDMGFAYEIKSPHWLMVEERISNDYMLLLSNIISKSDNLMPVSDTMKNAVYFDKSKSFYNVKQRDIFNQILDGVLPIPNDNISLDKLLLFKQDESNQKALINFRKFIEELSYKVYSEVETEKRQEIIEKSINQILESSKVIEEQMKSKLGIRNISLGRCLTIFGNGLGLISSSDPSSILSSISNLAGEVISEIKENSERKKEFYEKPLAYIISARKSFAN